MFRAQFFSISPAKMQQHRQFVLLVRPYARSITTASSRMILLGCYYQTSHSRQFSSSCRRNASPASDVPQWSNLRDVVRPAAMWLAPKDSKFNQQQVLDQLPKLRDSHEDLSVVLFLVTPKLAHLFEGDDSFHSRAINSIYGASVKGTLRQSIVAVVDALPLLVEEIPSKRKELEIDGSEGVAICIAPGFDAVPAKGDDSSPPVISMTAKRPYFDGQRNVSITCSAPVANTTFVNGRQNTLFMQNWRNRGGQKWLPETNRYKLGHVNVPMYRSNTAPHPVIMYSKIIKLTDPKVIQYSMGNIVRQVSTVNGEELAASHELEKIVPKMLKELQQSIPAGDIKVFALVYPHELGGKDVFVDHVWGGNQTGKAAQPFKHNSRLLDLLARGARLYRVTSGGAGWGKKAGLLSLEPMTELGSSTDASGIPSFIFSTDEDIRMPGSADLFPPGHIIQFIATFHDTTGSKKDAVSITDVEQDVTASSSTPVDWLDPDEDQHFCIGNIVLPETHHYTSPESIDTDSTENDPNDKASSSTLLFQWNHFGFLTSSALGFSVKYHSRSNAGQEQMKYGKTSLDTSELDANHKHSTLVELPNSYFVSRFFAGGKVTSEIVQQYPGSEELKMTPDIFVPRTLRRELTQEESVFVASQTMRQMESLQKDSYLARHNKPTMQDENESSVRIQPYEYAFITRVKSDAKSPIKPPPLVQRVKNAESNPISKRKVIPKAKPKKKVPPTREERLLAKQIKRDGLLRITSQLKKVIVIPRTESGSKILTKKEHELVKQMKMATRAPVISRSSTTPETESAPEISTEEEAPLIKRVESLSLIKVKAAELIPIKRFKSDVTTVIWVKTDTMFQERQFIPADMPEGGARRRRILSITSFKIRTHVSDKGKAPPMRITPEIAFSWTPSMPPWLRPDQTTKEWVRIDTATGEALGLLPRYVDSVPPQDFEYTQGEDEDEDVLFGPYRSRLIRQTGGTFPLEVRHVESTVPTAARKIEGNIDFRRMGQRLEPADLRYLGVISDIFRVYSDDGIHWDGELENDRERRAIEGLLADL